MRIVSLALLVPIFAWAQPSVDVASHIDAVTVYQGSARVTRIARVTLPRGDVRAVISGISAQLGDETVRVSGRGVPAKIFGVSVERTTHGDATSTEVRNAREAVLHLENQDRALLDAQHALEVKKNFIESLKSTYAEERTKNLPSHPLDTRELANMADFIAREDERIAEARRKLDAQRRDLAKSLTAARDTLTKIEAKSGQTSKTVVVDLSSEKSGEFNLEISYTVPMAQWTPQWDVRLDTDKRLLSLTLLSSIEQHTGEDWRDVALTVSTAAQAALVLPDLGSQYLEYRRQLFRGAMSPQEAPSGMALNGAARHAEEDVSESALEEAQTVSATFAQGLLSATYTAPRRETVDGAGNPHRAFLATYLLPTKIGRTAAPSVTGQVLLFAKTKNETGAELLAGPASIYLGNEFSGRGLMQLVPAGDDLKLGFGADDRVKIERTIVERRHETAGVFSKEELLRYDIRTRLRNLRDEAIDVLVVDRIPVSRDQTIAVKVLDGTTPTNQPDDPEKPGVRKTLVHLEPQSEQVLELRYEVRWPPGRQPNGLE